MPSILIELGFLTNAAEEDFLNSENGKAYMSSAIFRGFKEYKEMVEDPLPDGYVPPQKTDTSDEDKAAAESAKAEAAKVEKAKQDSIKKVEDQARLKAVADSLENAKQRLLKEKQLREAELAKKEEQAKKAEVEKQARLKATADSLEQVRKDKLAEMERKKKELEEQKVKEMAAQKSREDSIKLAEAEKAKKELEAKQEAKEWLEEIKEVKEKELEDAKRKAAQDAEKERLEAIKKQKEEELQEAWKEAEKKRFKAKVDSLAAIKLLREQHRIDSVAQLQAKEDAKKDSLANLVAEQQAKMDSLKRAQEEGAKRLAAKKARQDSIAAVRRKEAEELEVKIDGKQAATPEEAELLFLQLRKKQLEERIAKLKGQNVEEVTKETLEERAAAKPEPAKKVDDAVVSGVLLRVQVITSAEPISKDDPQFRGQEPWEYQQSGLYKYTVGSTQDFEEITKLQTDLRNLGFKGAFVVAFKDGERIKVSEARELLEK